MANKIAGIAIKEVKSKHSDWDSVTVALEAHKNIQNNPEKYKKLVQT